MLSYRYDYTAGQWNNDDGSLVRIVNENISYVMGLGIQDGCYIMSLRIALFANGMGIYRP
jgi:hypothetical protein